MSNQSVKTPKYLFPHSNTIVASADTSIHYPSHGMLEVTNDGSIIFKDPLTGTMIIRIDAMTSTISMNSNYNIDDRAGLFFIRLLEHINTFVPRAIYNQAIDHANQLEEQNRKDKQLLAKALKELGKQYIEGGEDSGEEL